MEGETLPRFDSKSRMSANVKYPREHRMSGYAQRAVFFHLEIVTGCASLQYYTVLVYVSVLVGSVHLRLFPIFPHVFHCQAHLLDTIYCAHMLRCTHIQCTCLLPRLLAPLFTSSGRSPFLLTVPCCSLWPSYLRPDRFQPLAVLACPRPCLPAPVAVLATLAPCAGPACSRCSRLYCSFSRRALARCSTLSARRKLFRDRFQAVDICSAVVRGSGWHDFILLYGLIWGRGDSAAISWYAVGLKKSFARG